MSYSQTDSDPDSGLSNKKIHQNTDPKCPSHIRHGKRNSTDQKRNEKFFIGFEASDERTEFKTCKNQKYPQNRIGKKGQECEPGLAKYECQDHQDGADHQWSPSSPCPEPVVSSQTACPMAHGNCSEKSGWQVRNPHCEGELARGCFRQQRVFWI